MLYIEGKQCRKLNIWRGRIELEHGEIINAAGKLDHFVEMKTVKNE